MKEGGFKGSSFFDQTERGYIASSARQMRFETLDFD